MSNQAVFDEEASKQLETLYRIGDVVRLEETRPLSKLKRWRLKQVVRKTALVPEHTAAEVK